jgi:hypothetical protein
MQIKVSMSFPAEPIERQTPQRSGVWKDCSFSINDPSASECDYWVVLEGLTQPESATVRAGKTVLFTMEPPDAKTYPKSFLRQFDVVISSHRGLLHHDVRHEYQALPWHIGLDRGARGAHGEDGFRCAIDYDAFRKMGYPDKPKMVSAICSIADALPGHRRRNHFIEQMRHTCQIELDIFGRGIRPVADKWEAIAPYQFHIVLENSSVPDYWTEKLADSYLGFSYPLYWGCPNIDRYFPKESYIQIDIDRPDEVIKLICALGMAGLSDERRGAMLEARRLVLEHYNTFEVVRRTCQSLSSSPQRRISLRPAWDCRASPFRQFAQHIKKTIRDARAVGRHLHP